MNSSGSGARGPPGPAEIHVKTGRPTFLVVTNLDSTPEEFEMLQLAIEKVIPGGTKARIRVRPLGPGRYEFIGEFHKDLAQGAIISEEPDACRACDRIS